MDKKPETAASSCAITSTPLMEREFKIWLRLVCFQAPPTHSYDLAKSAWKKAIELERECCAMLCEKQQREEPECPEMAQYCADAIRNRSNPKVHLRELGERKVEPVVGTPNKKGET